MSAGNRSVRRSLSQRRRRQARPIDVFDKKGARHMSSTDRKPKATRIAAVLGIAALLGVIALLSALPAGAQPVVVRATEPIDQTEVVTNSCTGEDVLVSLSGSLSFHVVFGGNVALEQVQTNLHGSGVGLSSGSTYILNAHEAVAENFRGMVDPNGAVVFSDVQNLDLISQGSAPNLVGTERVHATINSNGTVTVDSTELTIACHG